MKSIHTEKDLMRAVEIVLGRDMNADDKRRFEEALRWVNDPKKDYKIIDDIEEVLRMTNSLNYSRKVERVSIGVCIIGNIDNSKHICYVLSDDTVEDMVVEGLLRFERFGGAPVLTDKGREIGSTLNRSIPNDTNYKHCTA
ncbi:hypothetical protein NVP1118B_44 [Vibrio phage 1.118.B._10N.261.49.F6]|nr:hypothetical protein NVP1118A_44 [Vibrio phage 1.118.A._10N.261.49.F6]AUR88900.1 hypothetical protein NVP1118B_44 [Vibrio phage 1.118.B._10N.261.49.F6]